jgi:hypothetical protein
MAELGRESVTLTQEQLDELTAVFNAVIFERLFDFMIIFVAGLWFYLVLSVTPLEILFVLQYRCLWVLRIDS